MTKKTGPSSAADNAKKKTTTKKPTEKKSAAGRTAGRRSEADKIKTAKAILDVYSQGKHTIESCCEVNGITSRTLLNWSDSISEISALFKKAKEDQHEVRKGELRELAVDGLRRLVTGYFVEETEIQTIKNNRGVKVRSIETVRKKYISPQTTAIIFALKNLDPLTWNIEKQSNEEGEEQVFLIGEQIIKF